MGAIAESETRTNAAPTAQKWESADHNHEAWLFGRDELPRWLGYSLGFRLVEKLLSKRPDSRASKLAGAQAEDFRSTPGSF